MRELDSCLRDLVAAVRAAYQPTLCNDALGCATIVELTQLDEPPPVPVLARASESQLRCEHVVPNVPPPQVTVSEATEATISAIISGETAGSRISDAFDLKESALRTAFCALCPLEAAALRRRLVVASSDDKLATLFSRFTVERRARLLAVLADARRREALKQAGGRVAQRGAR